MVNLETDVKLEFNKIDENNPKFLKLLRSNGLDEFISNLEYLVNNDLITYDELSDVVIRIMPKFMLYHVGYYESYFISFLLSTFSLIDYFNKLYIKEKLIELKMNDILFYSCLFNFCHCFELFYKWLIFKLNLIPYIEQLKKFAEGNVDSPTLTIDEIKKKNHRGELFKDTKIIEYLTKYFDASDDLNKLEKTITFIHKKLEIKDMNELYKASRYPNNTYSNATLLDVKTEEKKAIIDYILIIANIIESLYKKIYDSNNLNRLYDDEMKNGLWLIVQGK